MERDRILAKFVVFYAVPEFGQIDMLEWPDSKPKLLS